MPMRWSRNRHPGPDAGGSLLLNRPARLHAAMAEADPVGALLDAAEAGPEDRVMVVGGGAADLLCASIRRGCRAALSVSAPPAHPEPVDVVLAPRVAEGADMLGIARSAMQALRGGASRGRLAMRLLGRGARSRAQALALELAAMGFAAIQIRRPPGGGIVITGQCGRPA
jgi:hypothetical protein